MSIKQLLLSRLYALTTCFLMLLSPFVTTLILRCRLPCPRSAEQTLLCSGLSNEILISAPLLLQCVLQKKNQYSARQRSSCRQQKVICYPNTDTQRPGNFREQDVLKGNLGKDRGKGAGENPPNKSQCKVGQRGIITDNLLIVLKHGNSSNYALK